MTAPTTAGAAGATAAGWPDTELHWVDGERPAALAGGTTWGVPWPAGLLHGADGLALTDLDGAPVPVGSRVTARWPDGSVKWTAHDTAVAAAGYRLVPGVPAAPDDPVAVTTEDGATVLTTAGACWVFPHSGTELVRAVVRDGRTVAGPVTLLAVHQDRPDDAAEDVADAPARRPVRTTHAARVRSVTVEQAGPVRAVVRVDAVQRLAGREWLHLTVRCVLHAGSRDLRLVHTVVVDAEPGRDLLAGLGVRVEVPLVDALHDRHVRIAGSTGFLTEAVRGVTGLRRDPGERVRAAQVAGRPTPPTAEWAPTVSGRLDLVPAWNDWSLTQLSPDGYTLRKRTGPGRCWVDAPGGPRSRGLAWLGGPSGGVAAGVRDFWRRHPTQLEVRDAATDLGRITLWLYSPAAPAMDLRPYHDGLGMADHDSQLEGLEITYEDHEPGFDDARGVARTHELLLSCLDATPDHEHLEALAAACARPPLPAASPERILAAGVFADYDLVDRSTPARAAIEDRLDLLLDHYLGEVERRRWYGFWDHGDVMHAYDRDRHTWRYDVGGYAWDNSELSPDLWLWYSYLRTGRGDVYRLAEAMTRHTSEVDAYHLGRFAGLGSRHNVRHWGCSAKQVRIANAGYRRFLYFLTADERTGDLLDEVVDQDATFGLLDPNRKVRTDGFRPGGDRVSIGLGTDWGALAAAWLTAWERTGDVRARDRLLGTMAGIGAMPRGFLSGEGRYDPVTGRFDTDRDQLQVSHLSAVFGLVEVCSELLALERFPGCSAPGFAAAWEQYCRLYLADPRVQAAEVGEPLAGVYLEQAHSRLTAYAARRTGDPALAARAWEAFAGGGELPTPTGGWGAVRVDGPQVPEPVVELPWLSTNDAAQFGLAAIQNLALIGDQLG